MSNPFGNLKNEGLEESQDRLGGFRVYDSGAMLGKIKLAYTGASKDGARFVTVQLEGEAGDYRETFYITNKKGENFYVKDGKKNPLPGFTVIDDLCQVTTGKALFEQATEDKVVNVYNPDEKKEIPTSVPMMMDLLGKEVIFGILKLTKNKQVKDSGGVYQDTAESRDENVVDKIFHHPSKMTVVEAKRGLTASVFYGSWVEKNTGVTQDRRKIKDGAGGQAGRPGTPPKANGAGAAKTTSLFVS